MDRKKFDDLPVMGKIEYINEQLSTGISLTVICKSIGIARSTVRDKFKEVGYYYIRDVNQYVNEEHVCNNDKDNSLEHVEDITPNNINTHVITEQLNNSDNNVVPVDVTQDVINMLNWFKDYQLKENNIKELLDWVQQQKDRSNVIDVPEIYIDPKWITGDVKTRSFTIYKKVLDKFIKFSQKQPYSQQDLLSMAILEYIRKYNK